MSALLALLLALNPTPGDPFYVKGWVVQVCKDQDCRYTPKPFPSQKECEEFAPYLQQHTNFEGWKARCVWWDGYLKYIGEG